MTDQAPLPSVFTAATRIRYGWSSTRPVTLYEVAVEVPSVTVVQVEPSVECWIT